MQTWSVLPKSIEDGAPHCVNDQLIAQAGSVSTRREQNAFSSRFLENETNDKKREILGRELDITRNARKYPILTLVSFTGRPRSRPALVQPRGNRLF